MSPDQPWPEAERWPIKPMTAPDPVCGRCLRSYHSGCTGMAQPGRPGPVVRCECSHPNRRKGAWSRAYALTPKAVALLASFDRSADGLELVDYGNGYAWLRPEQPDDEPCYVPTDRGRRYLAMARVSCDGWGAA